MGTLPRMAVEAGRWIRQNGITVNGDSCERAELRHGDVIGVNKFLLRFSNQEDQVPANLLSQAPKAAPRPKDIQRTVHLESGAVAAFAEQARQQIERQRAEMAARGGMSLGPPPEVAPPVGSGGKKPSGPAPSSRPSAALFIGGMLIGGAMVAVVLTLIS